MASFHMGSHTHKVPMTLFKENRAKLIVELQKVQRLDTKAVVLLQGGDNVSLYDTDVDYVFRQVSDLCTKNIFDYECRRKGRIKKNCYERVSL